MSLGTRIRERRKDLGWTQAKLSEESGISQQMLSKLERGVAFGTTEIVDLARALGVSAYWLETGEGPMIEEITQEDLQIIRGIHALDLEKRQIIIGVLNAMLSTPLIKLNGQNHNARRLLSPPPPPR